MRSNMVKIDCSKMYLSGEGILVDGSLSDTCVMLVGICVILQCMLLVHFYWKVMNVVYHLYELTD